MGSDYKEKPLLHPAFSLLDKLKSELDPISRHSDILGETHFVSMDVYETPDEVIVEMDLPGLSAQEINVRIQGGWLIVEGVKKEDPKEKSGVNFLCMERGFGPIRRQLKITTAIKADDVKGVYKDGVLVIKLPKRSERRNQAKHISIEGK